ncbi:MAG: carboxypeptidase regulatory-like domain-containing protein [Candidatus Omnitrophica bacterium]|nr:carboxypeptidase regulatory-like domain-containing protein [Candidatus Omnitrophota bacterium]
MGKVTGTVTLNNKPLPNVTVIFTPKEGGGNSYALTDQEGKYTLKYTSGKLDGALVGVHSVAIRDEGEGAAAGEEALPGGESRVPPKYAPEKSTLEKTVESGEQVIDLPL